jgi:hypothetical protein
MKWSFFSSAVNPRWLMETLGDVSMIIFEKPAVAVMFLMIRTLGTPLSSLRTPKADELNEFF